MSLSLHKAWPGKSAYIVAGTRLLIGRSESEREWRVLLNVVPTADQPEWEWWSRSQLRDKNFTRLHEVRDYIEALMQVDPYPELPEARLTRLPNGRYLVRAPGGEGYAFRNSAGDYWLLCRADGVYLSSFPTLALLRSQGAMQLGTTMPVAQF